MENETLKAVRELYDTGLHSDLKVICAQREFKVHKCIVSAHSPFFAKACKGNKWKEGVEGIIKLGAAKATGQKRKRDEVDDGEDEPDAVDAMFQWMYGGHYRVDRDPIEEGMYLRDMLALEVDMHARVYALGEKYQIPAMRQEALDYINDITEAWDVALDSDKLERLVRTVFSLAPPEDMAMRKFVAGYLHKHMESRGMAKEVRSLMESTDGLPLLMWEHAMGMPTDARSWIEAAKDITP